MTALMREAAGQDHVAGLDRAASDLVSFTTSRAIVTGENARRNSSIAVASAPARRSADRDRSACGRDATGEPNGGLIAYP